METNEILDTSIVMERKEGVITIFSVIEYPPSGKKEFDVLFPESMDYVKAIEIADALKKNGTPIGAMDIIISAMCMNRSSELLTKDSDFKNIKDVYPEFKVKINK